MTILKTTRDWGRVSNLHVLVGNRTVVPQKHKTSQNRSMENLKTHFL